MRLVLFAVGDSDYTDTFRAHVTPPRESFPTISVVRCIGEQQNRVINPTQQRLDGKRVVQPSI
jgi:hypothetical protein